MDVVGIGTVHTVARSSLVNKEATIQDQKAGGQKDRRTKRPGDGKACLFDAPRTRRLDWADSNVECLLQFVM